MEVADPGDAGVGVVGAVGVGARHGRHGVAGVDGPGAVLGEGSGDPRVDRRAVHLDAVLVHGGRLGPGLAHEDVVPRQGVALSALHVGQEIGPHLRAGEAVGLQAVLGLEVHDGALCDDVVGARRPQRLERERLVRPAPRERAHLVVALLRRRRQRRGRGERQGEVAELGQQLLQAERRARCDGELCGGRLRQVLALRADDAGRSAGHRDRFGGARHERPGRLVLEQRRATARPTSRRPPGSASAWGCRARGRWRTGP